VAVWLGVAAIAALAVLLGLSLAAGASVSAGGAALGEVSVPITGGTLRSATATGPGGRPIPVALRGDSVVPLVHLRPGEVVSLRVVVRRPGWIGWLAGSTVTAETTLRAPAAPVPQPYLTLSSGSPLKLAFDRQVRVVEYGQPGALHRRILATPASQVEVPRPASAGTMLVAGAADTWETMPSPSVVSWFPAGTGTSAVVSPAPGSAIQPVNALAVSFSQPVSAALGGQVPRFYPDTPGAWRETDAHTLVFHPSGYGFPLGATVHLVLPAAVRLLDGNPTWQVPAGSPERERQILAELGYLPVSFVPRGAPVQPSPHAQARAAVAPPSGWYPWRWRGTPAALEQLWQHQQPIVVRGALMAFENEHGLTADGVAGPQAWRALLAAAVAGRRSSAGYSFVSVSESSQSLGLWHDGRTVMTTAVNTGIASAPTAIGTYPVFEHIASGTMSGTNPDGSHYHDPGVPWISYFNGGDALHGFYRAQYGFPQSLGCVEMPVSAAGRVWPYTPIGTLVHVV
jgi:L,D-transpeptidase catalytic domain